MSDELKDYAKNVFGNHWMVLETVLKKCGDVPGVERRVPGALTGRVVAHDALWLKREGRDVCIYVVETTVDADDIQTRGWVPKDGSDPTTAITVA